MKDKAKKWVNVVLNVLMYLFLAICVLTVIMTLISRRDVDGAAEIFGYQMRIVTSESMAKCEHTDVSEFEIGSIPLRSMVFVQTVPDDAGKADEWYGDLEVGDVLTFRYVYTTQVTITHRIVSIEEKNTGGYVIELSGDNKDSDAELLNQTIDTSIAGSTNYVIGKVTGVSYAFGLVMSVLMSTPGIILIIMLPCAIIILLEVVKIVRILGADKKKRREEEEAEKNNEIEELRRRLAELEAAKENGSVKNGDSDTGEEEKKE